MAGSRVTLHQRRAQDAYEAVSRAGKNERMKKRYGSLCLRLPGLIQHCGLCQTVAFLQSKSDPDPSSGKHYFHLVLNDLAVLTGSENGGKLAEKVRAAPVKEYQRLTREAFACSEWLKRYSHAVLGVESGEDIDS